MLLFACKVVSLCKLVRFILLCVRGQSQRVFESTTQKKSRNTKEELPNVLEACAALYCCCIFLISTRKQALKFLTASTANNEP